MYIFFIIVYYIIPLQKINNLVMVEKTEISYIVKKAYNEIINESDSIDFNTKFTGSNSSFESIDIVQIISSVEDQLEDIGYEGIDLLEKTFETDELDFNDFIDLIKRLINK